MNSKKEITLVQLVPRQDGKVLDQLEVGTISRPWRILAKKPITLDLAIDTYLVTALHAAFRDVPAPYVFAFTSAGSLSHAMRSPTGEAFDPLPTDDVTKAADKIVSDCQSWSTAESLAEFTTESRLYYSMYGLPGIIDNFGDYNDFNEYFGQKRSTPKRSDHNIYVMTWDTIRILINMNDVGANSQLFADTILKKYFPLLSVDEILEGIVPRSPLGIPLPIQPTAERNKRADITDTTSLSQIQISVGQDISRYLHQSSLDLVVLYALIEPEKSSQSAIKAVSLYRGREVLEKGVIENIGKSNLKKNKVEFREDNSTKVMLKVMISGDLYATVKIYKTGNYEVQISNKHFFRGGTRLVLGYDFAQTLKQKINKIIADINALGSPVFTRGLPLVNMDVSTSNVRYFSTVTLFEYKRLPEHRQVDRNLAFLIALGNYASYFSLSDTTTKKMVYETNKFRYHLYWYRRMNSLKHEGELRKALAVKFDDATSDNDNDIGWSVIRIDGARYGRELTRVLQVCRYLVEDYVTIIDKGAKAGIRPEMVHRDLKWLLPGSLPKPSLTNFTRANKITPDNVVNSIEKKVRFKHIELLKMVDPIYGEGYSRRCQGNRQQPIPMSTDQYAKLKQGMVDADDHSIHTKAHHFVCLDDTYKFPGFISGAQGCTVCCYKKDSKSENNQKHRKLYELCMRDAPSQGTQHHPQQDSDYAKQFPKEIMPGRFGKLPPDLLELMHRRDIQDSYLLEPADDAIIGRIHNPKIYLISDGNETMVELRENVSNSHEVSIVVDNTVIKQKSIVTLDNDRVLTKKDALVRLLSEVLISSGELSTQKAPTWASSQFVIGNRVHGFVKEGGEVVPTKSRLVDATVPVTTKYTLSPHSTKGVPMVDGNMLIGNINEYNMPVFCKPRQATKEEKSKALEVSQWPSRKNKKDFDISDGSAIFISKTKFYEALKMKVKIYLLNEKNEAIRDRILNGDYSGLAASDIDLVKKIERVAETGVGKTFSALLGEITLSADNKTLGELRELFNKRRDQPSPSIDAKITTILTKVCDIVSKEITDQDPAAKVSEILNPVLRVGDGREIKLQSSIKSELVQRLIFDVLDSDFSRVLLIE